MPRTSVAPTAAIADAPPRPEALISRDDIAPGPSREAGQQQPLSAGHGLARGALALFSTQPLTWGVTLLTTLLLPRYLGDAGLGQYSIALNVANILGMVVALGVPILLTRRVAASPEVAEREGPAAFALVMAASVLGGTLLPFLEPYLGLHYEAGSKLLLAAMAWMIFWVAQKVAASMLNGRQRHSGFALLNAACVVTGGLAGMGALLAGGNSTAYLATTAAASMLVLGLGWSRLGFRLNRSAIDLRLWRLYAIGGAPFLIWDVALQIRNGIDVVLVGGLLGAEAAGWLAAGYKVISLPVFLPTIIMITLLPALTRAANDVPRFLYTLRRCVLFVVVVTVPAGGLIVALAPSIPDMLSWGPSFAHSVPLMMILALDVPLGAVDMVLGTAVFALRREKRWLLVGITGAAFNPLLNLVAIPFAQQHFASGTIAAASVEVMTELIMMAGALIVLPRGAIDRETVNGCMRVVLGAVVLVVTGTLLRPVNPILAALAAGFVYLAAIGLLRVVGRHEVNILIDAVSQAFARRRNNVL